MFVELFMLFLFDKNHEFSRLFRSFFVFLSSLFFFSKPSNIQRPFTLLFFSEISKSMKFLENFHDYQRFFSNFEKKGKKKRKTKKCRMKSKRRTRESRKKHSRKEKNKTKQKKKSFFLPLNETIQFTSNPGYTIFIYKDLYINIYM